MQLRILLLPLVLGFPLQSSRYPLSEQEEYQRIPQNEKVLDLIVRPMLHTMVPTRMLRRFASRWFRRYQDDPEYENQEFERIPQSEPLRSSFRLDTRYGDARVVRRYQNDPEYENQEFERIPQNEPLRSSFRLDTRYGDTRVARRYQDEEENQ
jgi:hypothetical protein